MKKRIDNNAEVNTELNQETEAINSFPKSANNPVLDWIIRVLKGMIIGIGGIIPGLSGGVLSVVFGVYDSLIAFLAHPFRNFRQNIKYFLPIIIGGILGIFVFAIAVSAALSTYEAIAISLFLGFVAGTLPALFKKAGARGRSIGNISTMFIVALVFGIIMVLSEFYLSLSLPSNFFVWIFSGVLIGLGIIVPGLSTSNFLLYFNLYEKMTTGISELNFSIIIPLVIGLVLSVLLLAKLFEFLFNRYYSTMYHLILGLVIGSTVAIIFTHVIPGITPEAAEIAGMSMPVFIFVIILAFILGAVASYLFSLFEGKVEVKEN